MPKLAWLVAAALVWVLLEWQPWYTFELPKPTAGDVKPRLDVQDPDAASPFQQPIRAQLVAVTYTTVSSEMSGRVSALHHKEGEQFKRGQRLVSFECSQQQAQLEKARAQLAVAERNWQANKKLYALGSIGRVELENSESDYLRYGAERAETEAVVKRCQILAPFNGKVVEQKVRPQQYVQLAQPILDIIDDAALELEFIAPSSLASWVQVGQPFRVVIDETGRSYPAKVIRVSPKIDPISQTYKLAGTLVDVHAELKPGMTGLVEFDRATTEK